MKRPVSRLFWKLFAMMWLAMLVSFIATVAYLWLTGVQLPPPPENAALLPWSVAASVSLFFSAAAAWYLSGPLRHLRWGLRRAAEERFDTRLMPLMGKRRDEIVDLAREFDLMASQLQRLTDTRRTLLHDLSHELRSPLARMHAAVGLWRQVPDDGKQLASRVEREIGGLDRLVEELLTLHRLESAGSSGAEPLALETLDLCELLEAIVDDADFEAQASGRRVALDPACKFTARVNGDLIHRAFENVVRNAIKYTPAGGCVEIGTQKIEGGTWLRVTIADRGPGVPADKLDAMFQPFVRVDSNPSSSSTGLGLALARRAVVSHGGRIYATLRSGGGLLVNIELPSGQA